MQICRSFSLKGKTAVVSGAAANIGLAISEAYAQAGCQVAMLYGKNPDALKRAEELASKNDVRVKAYQCDGKTSHHLSRSTVLFIMFRLSSKNFRGAGDCCKENSGGIWWIRYLGG